MHRNRRRLISTLEAPSPRRADRRPKERGFALIAALALLVVLGAIGAGMLRLTGIEQAGSSTAILGARAEWASQSGIEWAVYQAAATGSCPSGSLTLSEGALSGFTVVVSCQLTQHYEGSDVHSSLSIRSQASFGPLGARDFVYREMHATIML